ncbi:MAG TPA: T9SS type A sorting domain-containing protein, partial [Paludibacteraceae bacterium]|nr:T9SS type A sorting domain-containing protein [Paludibacteraceae bacterium]
VYPNPGSDYLIVQSGPQVSGAVFRMYNMQGRQVMEERLTSTLLRLNAGSLAAGPHPWQIIFNNNVIENGKWIKDK